MNTKSASHVHILRVGASSDVWPGDYVATRRVDGFKDVFVAVQAVSSGKGEGIYLDAVEQIVCR